LDEGKSENAEKNARGEGKKVGKKNLISKIQRAQTNETLGRKEKDNSAKREKGGQAQNVLCKIEIEA